MRASRGKKPASPWIGKSVRFTDGRSYGVITGVYDFGAGEVVDIEKPNGKIDMLPMRAEFLQLSADETYFIAASFEFSEAKPE